MTLYRYISWRVIRSLSIAFIVVACIIMLVDFVETSRDIDQTANIGAGQMLLLTALRMPELIEQTIPFIVLFGVMGALYTLNRKSELIVMRASGLSAWKFLTPVIFVIVILGIFWSTVLNPLAANTMNWHDSLIEKYLGVNTVTRNQQSDIWLREGTQYEQMVIYAPQFNLLKRTLYDAEFTLFQPDADGELVFIGRYDAKEAKLLGDAYWELSDVVENTLNSKVSHTEVLSLPTTITLDQLQYSQSKASLPSFWNLPEEIKRLSQAGFSTTVLRMQYAKLLALPLMLVAMVIIAAGVSMRLTRQGGTLSLLLFGGLTGFFVFFLQNIIQAFGEAGVVPIQLAVWGFPALVLLCGLLYLSIIEDG